MQSSSKIILALALFAAAAFSTTHPLRAWAPKNFNILGQSSEISKPSSTADTIKSNKNIDSKSSLKTSSSSTNNTLIPQKLTKWASLSSLISLNNNSCIRLWIQSFQKCKANSISKESKFRVHHLLQSTGEERASLLQFTSKVIAV